MTNMDLTLAGIWLGRNGESRRTRTGETAHDIITRVWAGGVNSTFILI